MKLVERTYARFAALMESSINNGVDEHITKKELDMFCFLVENFLCCFEFYKCKVTFDDKKDKILVYMRGEKESDVNYIYVSKNSMDIEFSRYSPDRPTFIKKTVYDKLCDMFRVDFTFDPIMGFIFSLNTKLE